MGSLGLQRCLGALWRRNFDGGGTALGCTLRVYSRKPLPVSSLCFMFAVEDVNSQLPSPAAMTAAATAPLPFQNLKPK